MPFNSTLWQYTFYVFNSCVFHALHMIFFSCFTLACQPPTLANLSTHLHMCQCMCACVTWQWKTTLLPVSQSVYQSKKYWNHFKQVSCKLFRGFIINAKNKHNLVEMFSCIPDTYQCCSFAIIFSNFLLGVIGSTSWICTMVMVVSMWLFWWLWSRWYNKSQ